MGVKISNLPAIVTPAFTDLFAVVQSGVTYKESGTQLSSLFATSGANTNITSLAGLTTPLSVAQGGTGSTTSTGSGSVVLNNNPNLIGTATNDNAAAGSVGQIIEQTILAGSAVALTTSTAANVASISLTAGDWNVWGLVAFAPAAGTIATNYSGTITQVSASVPTVPNGGASFISQITYPASAAQAFPTGMMRISLASTTTVYLVGFSVFSVSTMGAYGYIGARRVR